MSYEESNIGASVPCLSLLENLARDKWLSNAEERLAHLSRCRYSHEQAIRELDRAIETLEETMGNASAGGTAWIRSSTRIGN